MEKVKYITNKELLLEIDRSKQSFSYFTDPKYARYDTIVTDKDQITQELTNALLEKRRETNIKQGIVTNVAPEDIVFRLMTNEHIPIDPLKKKRVNKLDDGHTKTPFNAYKHFISLNDNLIEVGRSFWKGDLQTGYFSMEHGKISNRLAIMFMVLVERYAKRSNWRSYCVSEDTEALTQRGWLGIDRITENDIILSYDSGHLAWSDIKSIYRGDYTGKMFKMTCNGMDSLVTPEHKFVTSKGLQKVEDLNPIDKLVLTGKPLEDGIGLDISSIDVTKLTMPIILQLTQEQRVALIDYILGDTTKNNHTLHCHQTQKYFVDMFTALCTIAGYSLVSNKTELYLGGKLQEAYQLEINKKPKKKIFISDIDFHGGKGDEANIPTEEYNGRVWCPSTSFGSFMCRRNGRSYLSGNSYNEEMRCHALLQLSQVGLQFEESKSDNPFAFYTQIVKNSFTRILNLERKHQHIRDDLLIVSGVQPSYTRQLDNDIEQKNSNEERQINLNADKAKKPTPEKQKIQSSEPPKKRGRRPKIKVDAS